MLALSRLLLQPLPHSLTRSRRLALTYPIPSLTHSLTQSHTHSHTMSTNNDNEWLSFDLEAAVQQARSSRTTATATTAVPPTAVYTTTTAVPPTAVYTPTTTAVPPTAVPTATTAVPPTAVYTTTTAVYTPTTTAVPPTAVYTTTTAVYTPTTTAVPHAAVYTTTTTTTTSTTTTTTVSTSAVPPATTAVSTPGGARPCVSETVSERQQEADAWASFDLEGSIEKARRSRGRVSDRVSTGVSGRRSQGSSQGSSLYPLHSQTHLTYSDSVTPVAARSCNVQARGVCTASNTPHSVTHSQPSSQPQSHKPSSYSSDELDDALVKYFSFDSFRPGQREVVQAALCGRDCSVLWATGKGKSLCYILPALVSKKTSIVVSPLISLMTDQVTNLNNTVGSVENREVACYVNNQGGQGQKTILEAFSGRYSIVYLTPEMLPSCLDAITQLHHGGNGGASEGVCLLAVDEAHCISQWGQDFRAAFMSINCFRDTPALAHIPLMALTATAVPRVQADIKKSLRMSDDCLDSITSVDRTNLAISVRHQRAGGLTENLKFLETLFHDYSHAHAHGDSHRAGSTIVYVPTVRGVENITTHLRTVLPPTVRVESYHGKQGIEDRRRAHLAFLTGEAPVIVATIAFGMGIDKPDIRRIVHYGAPKSMEEYYQHIGRAGRDGLPSECILLFSESELVKYNSDFYTNGLSAQAKEQHSHSLNVMRTYANGACASTQLLSHSPARMSTNTSISNTGGVNCRRVFILKYFNEIPSYGRCGTCDICLLRHTHTDDLQRDYTLEISALVTAMTYPYTKGYTAAQLVTKILGPAEPASLRVSGCSDVVKKLLLKKYSRLGDAKAVLTQLLTTLTQPHNGNSSDGSGVGPLLSLRSISTKRATGYNNTYSVYEIISSEATHTRVSALTNHLVARVANPTTAVASLPYSLTVPDAVRELDAKKKAEKVALEKEFDSLLSEVGGVTGGFTLSSHANANGDGAGSECGNNGRDDPVLNWLRMLKRMKDSGRGEVAARREQLLTRIFEWRRSTALEYGMSPESVLKTAVAMQIALLQLSDVPSLKRAGVRITGVESLASVVKDALEELELVHITGSGSVPGGGESTKMIFTDGWVAQGPWKHASEAASAGTKRKRVPYWEDSWQQFHDCSGTLTSIAQHKNLQPATILKHILVAFTHARVVDLERVRQQAMVQYGGSLTPPDSVEWELISNAVAALGIDVCSVEKLQESEWIMLCAHLPEVGGIAGVPYKDRSVADNVLLAKWRNKYSWWSSLKQMGYPVQFAEMIISL